ncbi:putative O-methyltransferase domain, S-adenosyl-L-methionine-dependent methyltransferase [Septoria linicola]|nr:putative O-methyltransferase domain, S-adenosyl-L-methionine-dependent methyltransferase [Septoria linicola]
MSNKQTALKLALEHRQRAQDLVDALQEPRQKLDDESVMEAQSRLRSSARELERIFVQPGEFLLQLAVSQQLLVCIHWLCYFNIVAAVPTNPEETISYTELAQTADVPFATMKSVVRMAMIFGFFRETSDGKIQHTTLSSAFATDPNVYNWLMYMAKETAPTVAHFVKATERWPNSENKSETAYSLSRGTNLSFFDHINLVPERANEFGTYMKSQAANKKGTSVDLLAEGFDWASLGKTTVVDVGGGGGDASISLAEKFCLLDFVVQDLPTAIATAQQRISQQSIELSTRVVCQEHNFFDRQPVSGAAVYLLRMILHDWPDSECVKILKRLSAAMGPEGRIVIMDMVLPRPGTVPLELEAVLRQKDLVMKQNFNAKERELEEWEALMAKAGLRIVAVKTPRDSQHSVLEVAKA